MAEYPKGPLIASRVFIMGEAHIPGEELDDLSDEHIRIFLREPNPNKWPPKIAHLTKYLPERERIKGTISSVIANHDNVLSDSLKRWAELAWNELSEKGWLQEQHTELLTEEMASHLRELIENCIKRLAS
ncbi:MAG: hypothetical protein KAV83_06900 [Desulfobacterales bacterium]|nr:hypothetical protein [Desulfobacterales bacterium]